MTNPRFPKQITVLIDYHEQKPLEFPEFLKWWSPGRQLHMMKVRTKGGPRSTVSLPAGDYAIKGYEKYVLCERKGAATELCKNLFTKDRSRFLAALTRMAQSTAHPILLLDMPLAIRRSQWVREPTQVLDGLFTEAIRRRLDVLWFPPSRNPVETGERLLRYMWQAVYEEVFRYKPQRSKQK